MRTVECPCGIVPEARSDEELAREVLTHARKEHDASDLTEERAREMVASHSSVNRGYPLSNRRQAVSAAVFQKRPRLLKKSLSDQSAVQNRT